MNQAYFSSAAYALLYVRATRGDPEQMLRGTGYTMADLEGQDYMSADKLALMLRNIDAAGLEPGWAARVGEQLSTTSHDPLGFAALSAPTLGAALQVMMTYHAVRVTSITAEIKETRKQLLFIIHDLTGDTQYAQWLAETVLKVIESLIETVMGHPVGEQVQVSFMAPAPAYKDSLATTYGAPCQFSAAYDAIAIPRSWKDIRSPLYDESVYRANIARCREIIRAQQGVQDPVQQVRNHLLDHFEQVTAGAETRQAPNLELIADTLHITPRTLIRHLGKAETSFRSLLEEVRTHCAEELLGRANLSVADVGYCLGYSDPANFGRAFRRWKGLTPAAWRRSQ